MTKTPGSSILDLNRSRSVWVQDAYNRNKKSQSAEVRMIFCANFILEREADLLSLLNLSSTIVMMRIETD